MELCAILFFRVKVSDYICILGKVHTYTCILLHTKLRRLSSRTFGLVSLTYFLSTFTPLASFDSHTDNIIQITSCGVFSTSGHIIGKSSNVNLMMTKKPDTYRFCIYLYVIEKLFYRGLVPQ